MIEAQLQRAVVELLSVYERQAKLVFFSVPNGGKRSRVSGRNLVSQGMKRGAPDMVVVLKDGPVLFWELKTEKGRLSWDQTLCWNALRHCGHPYHIIRTVDDAQKRLIEAWL